MSIDKTSENFTTLFPGHIVQKCSQISSKYKLSDIKNNVPELR